MSVSVGVRVRVRVRVRVWGLSPPVQSLGPGAAEEVLHLELGLG